MMVSYLPHANNRFPQSIRIDFATLQTRILLQQLSSITVQLSVSIQMSTRCGIESLRLHKLERSGAAKNLAIRLRQSSDSKEQFNSDQITKPRKSTEVRKKLTKKREVKSIKARLTLAAPASFFIHCSNLLPKILTNGNDNRNKLQLPPRAKILLCLFRPPSTTKSRKCFPL